MSWLDIIFILGAFQGFLLVLAITLIRKKRSAANKYLAVLIGLITVALLARLSYSKQLIFDFPQILMLPDITLFVFGPTLYIYVKLLGQVTSSMKFKIWPHFIIPFIHFGIIVFLALKPSQTLWELIDSGVLLKPMYIMMLIGLVLNLFYVLKTYIVLKGYNALRFQYHSYAYRYTYMHVISGLISFGVLIALISLIISLTGTGVANIRTYNIIWIYLSFVVFALGFYSILQPQVLRNDALIKRYSSTNIEPEALPVLKRELETLMLINKPHLNPKLTLQELSVLADMSTNNLSRVINEGFEKNFFDFVNGFRVKEFIGLADNETHQKYTYLAIAKMAGFNAKSTFNAAFKKVTTQTPREYFRNRQFIEGNTIENISDTKLVQD